MRELLIAIALVLVLEGALYALAPAAMKKMMAQMLQTQDEQLRGMGLVAVVIGVAVVFLLKNLA